MIIVIVAVCVAMTWLWFWLKNRQEEAVTEPQVPESPKEPDSPQEPEGEAPAVEPVNGDPAVLAPPHELPDLSPRFSQGDKITDGDRERVIIEVRKVCYVLDNGELLPMTEQEKWTLVTAPAIDPEPDPNTDAVYQVLWIRFNAVVPFETTSKTFRYIFSKLLELRKQADGLLTRKTIPTVYDYFGTETNRYAQLQMEAWMMGLILTELVPEKRQKIMETAYTIGSDGQNWYGWTPKSDPFAVRWVASLVYAATREDDIIPELRKELGSKTISYQKDISELFLDLNFLPSYPKEAAQDKTTRETVARFYHLDSEDETIRQRTIQAVSDKEYKKPHLFGSVRSVNDEKLGAMWFNPVFGQHNLDIDISPDGAIAKFAYAVGRTASDNRKSLLDREYGRHRPGQGAGDPSAAKLKKERALVNYAIEEGDGHTTGYYNKGGDYVNNDGQHIGDYETYFQSQLYANSYPSGHSAHISGVAAAMAMVMPDKLQEIMLAMNDFALSRIICRYHWLSDTIMGRTIGTMMLPIYLATTNTDALTMLKAARDEYAALMSLGAKPDPVPTQTTEKVNLSLAYQIGGYGSCHVDAGEQAMNHYCNKECNKERHPSITVSQTVQFTIEGGGMKTIDGKTQGTWEADKSYELVCPMVGEGEERVVVITMKNENGVRILNYTLSRRGTHDDGTR